MPENADNPLSFFKELKRRKVIRVIIVYAAASFVILELISIIQEPFGLPDWTLRLIFIILCVGLIISIILSWIYDITPQGIEKTNPAKEVKEAVPEKPSTVNTWKIATYISIVVIIGLIIFNIFGRRGKVEDFVILDKSIAVLPFKSLSEDPEKQYLADGVMDAILLHLTKIQDLRVMARTSVEQYRETKKTATIICEELDVAYLLEGSFQKYGDQARLILQLIEPGTEGHIWAKEYDRNWTDIFSVQSEVAQLIARELQAVITPEEQQLIEKKPTTSLTAYDFYQRGIEEHFRYWEEYDLYHINKSIDYFSKAIELDPEYSLAYTGMARGYWMLGHYATKPLPDHWNESKRLSNKAIELDPENSLAYAHLGVVQHNWDWDTSAARFSFDKALTLSPNNEDCLISSIWLEFRLGNCDKLASLIERRSKINSYVNPPASNLMFLTCRQDFEKIRRIGDNKWNYNTGIQPSFYFYVAYVNNGNYDKALKIAESIEDKSNDPSISLSVKGHIFAMMGDRDGAMETIQRLNMLSDSRNISNILFANIYDALGDKDRTLEFLERALNERDWRIHAFYDPTAFNLINKNEPWLKEFIQRLWVPYSDTK